ncbi:MAG: hypothetical protein CMF60_07760 [Magnetococcales bacterium]|nr:hypothetical protein [Magnetococcales bacterium]|tara:strand:+ start:5777 stop:6415 length:639 start_codon:yes stop_codon:yes gene_type:complete
MRSKVQVVNEHLKNPNFVKTMNKALKEAAERHCKTYGVCLEGIKIQNQSNIIAFEKKPKGSSKIVPYILECMLKDDDISKTQKQYIEQACEQFPEHKIPNNIWNKKLYNTDKLQKIIDSYYNGKRPIDVEKCKSLSDVRKMWKKAKSINSANISFNAKVVLSGRSLYIGKKHYKVEPRDLKGKKVASIRVKTKNKYQWIRLDALLCFLDSGK